MNRPSQEIIKTVLSKWGLSVDVTFIRKVENFVYSIDNEDSILRITHSSHRNIDDLNAELNWLDFLMSENIHFAHPVKNKNDKLIHQFSDQNEIYFAVIFKKAKGSPLLKPEDFSPENIKSWAQTLAQLHQATKKAPAFNRPPWDKDLGFVMSQATLSEETSETGEIYSRQISWLHSLPTDKNCFGLIHADIHNGNFHVDKQGSLTLFDFDDCQYHWFSYDIAVPIYSLMYMSEVNGLDLNMNKIYETFITSYLMHNNLSNDWISKVPEFIKYRAALLHFWAKSKLKTNEIEPEHIQKVKKQLEWSAQLAARGKFLFQR